MVTGQCKKSGYTLKHPHRHYLNSTEQTINLFASHLVFHQHSYDRSVFLFSSLLGNPSIVLRIVIKISVTFIQQEVALFSAFVIVFVTVFLSLSLDDGWRQPQVRNQSTKLSVGSSQQIHFIHPLLLLHIILSAQNRFSLSLSIRPCKTSCIVLIGLSSSSLVSKSIPTAAGVCGVMELTVNRIPP